MTLLIDGSPGSHSGGKSRAKKSTERMISVGLVEEYGEEEEAMLWSHSTGLIVILQWPGAKIAGR